MLLAHHCIVSCLFQQPNLPDAIRLEFVRLILKSRSSTSNQHNQNMAKFMTITCVLKNFEALSFASQSSLITPHQEQGIVSYLLVIMDTVDAELITQDLPGKSSLYHQWLVCMGVFFHTLESQCWSLVLKDLIQSLLLAHQTTTINFILDCFSILKESGMYHYHWADVPRTTAIVPYTGFGYTPCPRTHCTMLNSFQSFLCPTA